MPRPEQKGGFHAPTDFALWKVKAIQSEKNSALVGVDGRKEKGSLGFKPSEPNNFRRVRRYGQERSRRLSVPVPPPERSTCDRRADVEASRQRKLPDCE